LLACKLQRYNIIEFQQKLKNEFKKGLAKKQAPRIIEALEVKINLFYSEQI